MGVSAFSWKSAFRVARYGERRGRTFCTWSIISVGFSRRHNSKVSIADSASEKSLTQSTTCDPSEKGAQLKGSGTRGRTWYHAQEPCEVPSPTFPARYTASARSPHSNVTTSPASSQGQRHYWGSRVEGHEECSLLPSQEGVP